MKGGKIQGRLWGRVGTALTSRPLDPPSIGTGPGALQALTARCGLRGSLKGLLWGAVWGWGGLCTVWAEKQFCLLNTYGWVEFGQR